MIVFQAGSHVIFNQFAFLGWPEGSIVPSSTQNFNDFIEAAMKYHKETTEKKKKKGPQVNPVVVQCLYVSDYTLLVARYIVISSIRQSVCTLFLCNVISLEL